MLFLPIWRGMETQLAIKLRKRSNRMLRTNQRVSPQDFALIPNLLLEKSRLKLVSLSLFKKANPTKPAQLRNSRSQKQSLPQSLQTLLYLLLKRALRNLLFKRWLPHVKSKRKIIKFLKLKKKILGECRKLPCYRLRKSVNLDWMRSKGEK